MNPVVVIASHLRSSITRQNIQSLLRQSVVPEIVLVVSVPDEYERWKKEFPIIHVLKERNWPLGKKWQAGVDHARKLNADPMIITGSDDILGVDFVKNACSLSRQHDFIGLQDWSVLHESFLYSITYNAKIPLGAGRVYSNGLLEAMNWIVFNTRINRHLDDQGYHNTRRLCRPMLIVRDAAAQGLHVVSVKGPWVMMNRFVSMLQHPNCTVRSKVEAIEVQNLIGFKPIV
ncbi:MAG TPA: hypothetical protein VK508_01815 [Cyclobacteriaceae bacterium]|nr:hypothetical protein [Cyclobacteriaceae bacterium]